MLLLQIFSCVALGMTVPLPNNIYINIGWIGMNFGTDIHALWRINPKDFGHPLAFD